MAAAEPAAIRVVYPREGSQFPPDFAPPLQWIDPNPAATVWRVEMQFGERGPHIKEWSTGERMQVGPLASNLPVMNSRHTFSPNGRWLAFSSKSPSLYTELYLTHIVREIPALHGDPDRSAVLRQAVMRLIAGVPIRAKVRTKGTPKFHLSVEAMEAGPAYAQVFPGEVERRWAVAGKSSLRIRRTF